MSGSPATEPPSPLAHGEAGAAVLVAALEEAPAAVYCLAGGADSVVWANASARAVGPLSSVPSPPGGRSVADVVADVVRNGRSETWSGLAADGGAALTAVIRPLVVGGSPGALAVVERDALDTVADRAEPAGAPGAGDVVDQVQTALLPPSLPLLPHLGLSGSYHRASSERAAGGDWYDAVPVGRGRVALVVGDAVGHGVPAAGAMGRLRGALRSSILREPSPAAVLSALDSFAAQMADVEGASVFYGVLDVATGRLTYAAAGHPAPLIVHPDGETSFLPVTPRPPLGSVPGSATAVREQVLEEGATLVLFSDGALAAAAAGPAEGLARFAESARDALAQPGATGAQAVAGLAAAIAEAQQTPDGRPDDVAVLVAHRRADALRPFRLDLPAVPPSLPVVRRRLVAWLTALGMGEQDRVGIMVAVGEACANAAEHAYRDGHEGPMHVTASVDMDGVLTITVRDEGAWRPPDRDPGDRGRGLLIMRQLVDGVTLEEEHGTKVTLSMRVRTSPDVEEDPATPDAGAAVTVDRSGERPVVRVTGAVDHQGAEQLRIRLLEASRGGTQRVELDLCDVVLFSSSAVRVVLAIARIARDEGWRLAVHAPEGGVTRHILEISGLGGLVDLH